MGFCKQKLVSNNHVFHSPDGGLFPPDTLVRIKFGDTNENGYAIEKHYKDFLNLMEVGSTTDANDYAVIDISNLVDDMSDRHQFVLAPFENIIEGNPVIIQGFPFDLERLTTHAGIISAKFQENNLGIIQIDASVNNGNSGGPLVNLLNGEVFGIVTRKLTGLEHSFNELLKSFDENINALQKIQSSGMMARIGGIDLIAMTKITQGQMRVISQNLQRSANVGIGYAFACDQLMKENFYSVT